MWYDGNMTNDKPNPIKDLFNALGDAAKDNNPEKMKVQAAMVLGGLALKNPKTAMQMYTIAQKAKNVAETGKDTVEPLVEQAKNVAEVGKEKVAPIVNPLLAKLNETILNMRNQAPKNPYAGEKAPTDDEPETE